MSPPPSSQPRFEPLFSPRPASKGKKKAVAFDSPQSIVPSSQPEVDEDFYVLSSDDDDGDWLPAVKRKLTEKVGLSMRFLNYIDCGAHDRLISRVNLTVSSI